MSRFEVLVECVSALVIALISALVIGFLTRFARASEYEQEDAILCKAPEQMERYLSLEGERDAKLAQVTNCALTKAVFVQGDTVKLVAAKEGTMFHIVEVGVVALNTPWGVKYLLKPEVFYVAFQTQEKLLSVSGVQ